MIIGDCRFVDSYECVSQFEYIPFKTYNFKLSIDFRLEQTSAQQVIPDTDLSEFIWVKCHSWCNNPELCSVSLYKSLTFCMYTV